MSKSEELDYFGNSIPVATILGSESSFTYPSSELSNKVSPSAPDGNISFEGEQPSQERKILELVRSYLDEVSPGVKYGPRADQKSAYGWFDSHNTWKDRFPLHRAAMRGEVREIKRLCASGHDPNKKMADWFDSEPLGWAASFGELKAVIALIECGADPLRPANKAGNTPLRDAQREKHESTIAFLKWYKIQVKGDVKKKFERMSEHQKLEYIFNFEKYENQGPRPDQNLCITTLLCLPALLLCPNQCCATWGYSTLLDRLTSLPCKFCPCSPCDPNAKNPLWWFSQPIGWAASHGQLHTVMVLVKNGADPSEYNVSGYNAYSDAGRENHFHILEWLDDWEAAGRPTAAKMNR